MNIMIYHRTTDKDLYKGLQVCYQDINGVFNRLGIITDAIDDNGILLYLIDTAMGSYVADELKLIEETPLCQEFCERFDQFIKDHKSFTSAISLTIEEFDCQIDHNRKFTGHGYYFIDGSSCGYIYGQGWETNK